MTPIWTLSERDIPILIEAKGQGVTLTNTDRFIGAGGLASVSGNQWSRRGGRDGRVVNALDRYLLVISHHAMIRDRRP